jgi:hypothetical protein
VDEMNPEARRHLRLAREELTPGDEDKRRVRKALAVGLAAAAAAAGASSTEAAAAAKTAGLLGAWGLRGLAGVLLIASTGTGAYWWTHRHSAAPVAQTSAPSQEQAQVAPASPPDNPAPQVDPPSEAPVAAPPPKEQEHPRAARSADPLVNELTLLHRAQQAWRDGKAQQALDLAQQHAATYPHSQFAMERSVVQVFALCALGRKGEAKSIATGLIERAPKSPLRTSLEESCAMK